MPASSPPSAGRSHIAAPLPAGSHPQSEPHNEPEHRAPRSSSPGPCRCPTKAICCRIFTPAQPDCPAASMRDFCSGAYSFGFIARDGAGKDVFVHISALERSGLTTLSEGLQVVIDVVEGRKGLEAARVRLV